MAAGYLMCAARAPLTIIVIVMSDRIECARCRGPDRQPPNPGAEPTLDQRSGAMPTRSTRRIRRYSTIMALGLMTAISKLIRAFRMVRSGGRAR
jgi:hypothetical protein